MMKVLIKIGKFLWSPVIRAVLGLSLAINLTEWMVAIPKHTWFGQEILFLVMILPFFFIGTLMYEIWHLKEELERKDMWIEHCRKEYGKLNEKKCEKP